MSKIDEIIERAKAEFNRIKDYKNDPFISVEELRQLEPWVELVELIMLNSVQLQITLDKRHFTGEYPHSNIYKLVKKIQATKTPSRLNQLAAAAEPLMKYLAENYHPHATAIVTSGDTQLVEGLCTHVTDKFIKD